MQGHAINDYFSGKGVPIMQELDLGQHSLVLMSDGSLDVLAHEAAPASFAQPALHLDEEETYRLFISLHCQFQQRAAHPHSQEVQL